MLKIVDNTSFNWDNEPLGSIIKVSSDGLVGSDRQEFLKVASASLLDKVGSIKVNPGEELVHLIALGNTENWGPNRNGDGFSKQACKDYHHYFVKDAKVYRNHKNTDPKKSYGVVKASEYNDDMNRVELIVALNTNEKAAKANEGLVADKEMEKLASDKPLAVSMACSSDPLWPILTKNGYRPIKDIRVGDEVFTKERRYRKVIELNRRNFTGYVYTIISQGTKMKLTEGHLLWVKRGNNEPVWMEVEKILLTDTLPSGEHKEDYYGITSISREFVKDIPVYNFEVDDDHSYVAAGIISHNCRVPFDKCSYCGNKAHTRDEYCTDVKEGGHCKAGGLKHNLGKMASVDGKLHQLYADNTQPYFFDISHVFVPADRIAYASGFCKRANTELIGGAELAELYGVSSPEKRAHYGQPDDYSHLFRVFFDAVNDFHNNKGWTKVSSYLSAVDTEPLSSPETTWQYSSGALTKVLNDQHICLTPTQFLQVETGLPLSKCASLGEIIGPLSNERFKELLVADDVFNPYMPQGATVEKLQNWGYRQKCARLGSESSMLKQAAHNSIAGLPPVTISRENIYSFEDDEEAKRLSANYALYKVAFLSSIPENQQKAMADLLVGRDYLSY